MASLLMRVALMFGAAVAATRPGSSRASGLFRVGLLRRWRLCCWQMSASAASAPASLRASIGSVLIARWLSGADDRERPSKIHNSQFTIHNSQLRSAWQPTRSGAVSNHPTSSYS
jgi:hypothetical protein